jgi:small conductance mechanosensitive channel
VEGVLQDPAPEALTAYLAESDVKIRVLYWTRPPRWSNLIRVQARVIAAIKKGLSEQGIDLPYPTTQILFHDQTEEGDGDRQSQREVWPAKPQHKVGARNVAHVPHEYLREMGSSIGAPPAK